MTQVAGRAPLNSGAVVPVLHADDAPTVPAAVVAPATSLDVLCFPALLSVVVTPVVGPAPLRPVVMIPVVGPAPLSPVVVVPELRADDVPAVHGSNSEQAAPSAGVSMDAIDEAAPTGTVPADAATETDPTLGHTAPTFPTLSPARLR